MTTTQVLYYLLPLIIVGTGSPPPAHHSRPRGWDPRAHAPRAITQSVGNVDDAWDGRR